MSLSIPERVYAQYSTKPSAKAWFGIVPTIGNELSDGLYHIQTSYNIDSATGAQLDVIGRIVGVDRSYENAIDFVGLQYGEDIAEFGGIDAQFTGSGQTVQSKVTDSIYRMLIRAKIAKNNSDATIEGILGSMSIIVGNSDMLIVDNEDMTFSIQFNFELTSIQLFVLDTYDIVPRPQGVQFLGYTDVPLLTQFGGANSQFGGEHSEFNNVFF